MSPLSPPLPYAPVCRVSLYFSRNHNGRIRTNEPTHTNQQTLRITISSNGGKDISNESGHQAICGLFTQTVRREKQYTIPGQCANFVRATGFVNNLRRSKNVVRLAVRTISVVRRFVNRTRELTISRRRCSWQSIYGPWLHT